MAGKRKISEKQLRALARGRKKALANRRAKKKAGTRAHPRTTRKKAPVRRRRNPTNTEPPRMFSTIRVKAPQDRNGNPRRLYLVFVHGNLRGIFDEEYAGDHAITDEKMRRAYQGFTVDITASEYNSLNKVRKSGAYKSNPAYGNFLNAIAAKERGGLGREAYQNPVRPLHQKPIGDYMVMRGTRYWTGYSFTEKRELAARYMTVKAAGKMANRLANKTGTQVKVVLAARHLK